MVFQVLGLTQCRHEILAVLNGMENKTGRPSFIGLLCFHLPSPEDGLPSDPVEKTGSDLPSALLLWFAVSSIFLVRRTVFPLPSEAICL